MAPKKQTILLIEDSVSTRATYKNFFEKYGYDILEAENGEKGWALTRDKLPDLVVLDLLLPDIHGLEVLKNIRSDEKTKNIPVLVLTNVREAEDIQKTKTMGASHYAHKESVTPKKIIEIVENLLKKS